FGPLSRALSIFPSLISRKHTTQCSVWTSSKAWRLRKLSLMSTAETLLLRSLVFSHMPMTVKTHQPAKQTGMVFGVMGWVGTSLMGETPSHMMRLSDASNWRWSSGVWAGVAKKECSG
ncbi:hypothetical protein OG21DRAFT_1585242, partial [Imleria badia]